MIYQLSLVTTGGTSATPAWGYLADAANSPKILQLRLNQTTATTTVYGIGIAAAAGTQTGAVAPIAHVSGAATALGRCAVAWSAAPTVPTQFLERITFSSVIGGTQIFDYPYGLVLAAGSELVVWNIGSNGTNYLNVTVVVEE